MSDVPGHEALIGRAREFAALAALVDEADQRGAALLLRGEPGIGKSFLLDAVAERARHRGFRVLSGAGVVPESEFPFAGLHRVLRPVLGAAGVLPAVQRDALDAAFGVTDDAVPDLFLVAMAALTLISTVAAKAPVLIVVDDVHWLDRPTRDALEFIARRIEYDPIVVLGTARFDPGAEGLDIPELTIDRLADADAAALLEAHAPGLSAARRQRVLETAAGNPLALLELPSALRSDRRPPAAALLEPPPLTVRLERAFAERARALRPAPRTLLLIAAVDETGDVAEILRACQELGDEDGLATLDGALGSGLVEVVEETIRFRHPLVRSAVAQAAKLSERHEAHLALSRVLVDAPDRRTWHRAAAITGQDDDVADALAEGAERARRRGAAAVAVAWLARASRLSSEGAIRAGRLLQAADMAFELGNNALVTELVDEASTLELAAVQRARMEWLREMIGHGTSAEAERLDLLLGRTQDAIDGGEPILALQLLLAAALHCWWHTPREDERERVVAMTLAIVEDPADPFASAIIGLASPFRHRALVVERIARVPADDQRQPDVARMLGIAASAIGDLELAVDLHAHAVEGLRAQGRLGLLAAARNMQAWGCIDVGALERAIPAAEEALRLAEETDQPPWVGFSGYAVALVAAVLGRREEAASRLEAADRLLPLGRNDLAARAALARGVAALTYGDDEEALAHLLRLFDPGDEVFHRRQSYPGVTYLADAAVQCGRPEAAVAALEGLGLLDLPDPPPVLRDGLTYAGAMLAGPDDAAARFESALRRLEDTGTFTRARLQLGYGRRLRRNGQVAEARTHLRAARDAFGTLGAEPWAEQARSELRAAGEASRRAADVGWHRLSPQEMQIALLAAEGLSNRELGERLYLSHRTIASHLYRMFPKLGITSRAQLALLVSERAARA